MTHWILLPNYYHQAQEDSTNLHHAKTQLLLKIFKIYEKLIINQENYLLLYQFPSNLKTISPFLILKFNKDIQEII